MGFFPLFLSFLNRENIIYAVLRNYDDLPQKPLPGSDVDLLIDKKDKERYWAAVKSAAEQTDSFILLKSDRSHCLSLFICQKNPYLFGFWLDAFTEISSKSFVWGDRDFLLKGRVFHPDKNFFTLSGGAEAAILFVKEILGGPSIKERYRLKIPGLVFAGRQNFISVITPYLGVKIAQEMADICRGGDWEKAFKKRKIWLFQLTFSSFLHRPLRQKTEFFNFILGYLKWKLRKKGVSIAVIGPDGVGKTTVCDILADNLKNIFFKKIYQYHGHFGFFPEWGKVYRWILRKESGQGENFPRPERKISAFRAVLSILYYGLEHLLAWPWISYLIIKGNPIIFDRYFYDFVTLNTAAKFPFTAFWFLSKLIHHPDLVFVLQADPKTIYARKKELSPEEINRQSGLFKDIRIKNLTSVIFINGEGPFLKVADDFRERILQFLSRRNY